MGGAILLFGGVTAMPDRAGQQLARREERDQERVGRQTELAVQARTSPVRQDEANRDDTAISNVVSQIGCSCNFINPPDRISVEINPSDLQFAWSHATGGKIHG